MHVVDFATPYEVLWHSVYEFEHIGYCFWNRLNEEMKKRSVCVPTIVTGGTSSVNLTAKWATFKTGLNEYLVD
jgi:hypothetical protein